MRISKKLRGSFSVAEFTNVKNFEVAGMSFLLTEEGRFQYSPMTTLGLPVALVCGLAAASYEFPEQKQAILDALTPFQIVSKIWSSQCAQDIMRMEDSDETRHIVHVGSWFGQQSALMVRSGAYYDWSVQLVDKDPEACRVAAALLRMDSYHRRAKPVITPRDIFELETFAPGTTFVWNGLEHFEPADVEKFLDRNSECAFVFQSTSMPATDHNNLAFCVDDILKAVPAGWDDGIVYKGELQTELGSRFMMAILGPGFDPGAGAEDDEEE